MKLSPFLAFAALCIAGCTATSAPHTADSGKPARVAALTVSSHVPRAARAAKFLRDDIESTLIKQKLVDKVEKEADQEDIWVIVTISDMTTSGRKSLDEGEPAVESTLAARISFVQRSRPDHSDVIKGVASTKGGIILAGTTQAALDEIAKQVADHIRKHYAKRLS